MDEGVSNRYQRVRISPLVPLSFHDGSLLAQDFRSPSLKGPRSHDGHSWGMFVDFLPALSLAYLLNHRPGRIQFRFPDYSGDEYWK